MSERFPLIENTFDTVRRITTRGLLYDMLALHTRDMVVWEDDFLGDALHSGYATNTSGTGAVAAAIASNALGGATQLVTGTDDNGYSTLYLGSENFTADQDAIVVARVKMSAITTVKVEVGFIDDGTAAGAINALDTPTATATDAVCAIFDTDATEDNWQFAGVRNGTAWSDATVDTAPVADTYQWIGVVLKRINLATDNVMAELWIDGVKKATKSLDAVSNTVSMAPYIFAQARAASASRTVTCDYLSAYQLRDTSA